MRGYRRVVAVLATTVCIAGVSTRSALSFKLSPTGTVIEKNIAKKSSRDWFERVLVEVAGRGVHQFTAPVHEEITQRIYDCVGEVDLCGDVDVDFASPYVLAGVRWNDDPPFQLLSGEAPNTVCKTTETVRFTTQPRCWYQLFHDAENRAARGKALDAASRASLLARSHFGDLAFLHGMAAVDGERASDTKAHIMMWAEFTWKVNRGEYALDTRLKEVDVPGFAQYFGRYEWRVQDLFALGNPVLRQRIKEVAFGSLLHMVEDSFAKGHADRGGFGTACLAAPGRTGAGPVKEFHSYLKQDHAAHAVYDSRAAFITHLETARPNVVDVGMALRAYQEKNTGPALWDEVRPYLDCVFAVENPDAQATAGSDFRGTR